MCNMGKSPICRVQTAKFQNRLHRCAVRSGHSLFEYDVLNGCFPILHIICVYGIGYVFMNSKIDFIVVF